MSKRKRHKSENTTSDQRTPSFITAFLKERGSSVSKRNLVPISNFTHKLPKKLWAFIGTLALILGLFFNFSVDLPEFISKIVYVPTPLPFPKANPDTHEVLIIITDFSGADGVTASTRIFRNLVERAQNIHLDRVRIERLNGAIPIVSKDAQDIGLLFDATLVIWGTADSYGIEPRYEVVENKETISTLPNLGITLSSNPTVFSTYVVVGLPNEYEYLMLITLGQVALYSSNYSEAISLFKNAIITDLGSRASELRVDDVYEFRAKAYEKANNLDASYSDLNQAIKLNPRKASHYFNRAIINWLRGGDINVTLEDLNKTINIDPKYPMAYVDRGVFYRHIGKTNKALEDYQHAIDLGGADALYAYSNRSVYYQDLGEFEKAENDLDQAINIVSLENFEYNNAIKAIAWNDRGKNYINQGKYEQAVNDLTYAIELNPNELSYRNNRATAYSGMAEYKKAITDLTYIIDSMPNDPAIAIAYSNRGVSYAYLGKYELAISDIKRSLELEEDPKSYQSLGEVYLQIGLKSEALAALEKYLELSGDSAAPNVVNTVKALRSEMEP